MRAVIYRGTHKVASYARDIGDGAGIPTVRTLPRRWVTRYRDQHMLVNWGCTTPPTGCAEHVGHTLNNFDSVKNSVDKLRFFGLCREAGVHVPDYFTNRNTAQTMLRAGHTIIARTLARSSRGRGIVVLRPGDEVVEAPLYTEYFNGAAEYRVHVFRGGDPFVTQKRRRDGSRPEGRDLMIRNWGDQWVFCVNNVTAPPEGLVVDCFVALDVLGLDFAAFDCRAKRDGTWVLLEANTAPGVEGTVLSYYIENVKRLVNNE